MTERFIRHGNYLTVVTIVDDPIYLEEPFIRTTNWVLNPDQEVRRTQFDVVDEVAGRAKGEVPHYLPGSPDATRKLTEFASKYKLPAEGCARRRCDHLPGIHERRDQAARLDPQQGTRLAVPTAAFKPCTFRATCTCCVGAGGNIVVQAGEEGVLVIDTGHGGARRRGSRGHPARYPTNRSASSSTRMCTPITPAQTRPSPPPAVHSAGTRPATPALHWRTRESWHTRTSSSE